MLSVGDKISELKEILGGFLFWNKARLDCFSRMLVGLFRVKTVNLKEIAVGFVSPADVELIARWICKLFFPAEKKFYLTIDRTNWFFGKAKINILVIAMAYEGIAIPLFWKFLNKAGNASAKEHVEILQRFIKNLGKDCILGGLGDREFGSKTFFSWLNKKKILVIQLLILITIVLYPAPIVKKYLKLMQKTKLQLLTVFFGFMTQANR